MAKCFNLTLFSSKVIWDLLIWFEPPCFNFPFSSASKSNNSLEKIMLNIQCESREFNLPYAVTKTIGEVLCLVFRQLFESVFRFFFYFSLGIRKWAPKINAWLQGFWEFFLKWNIYSNKIVHQAVIHVQCMMTMCCHDNM